MLILEAWCTVPPAAAAAVATRTYVGLIHIIEDDNEYESFFIDPTSFWLSSLTVPAAAEALYRGSIKMVGTSS